MTGAAEHPGRDDWTAGPAKWAAVAVLAAASITGMAWSILGRTPRPHAAPTVAAAPAPEADTTLGDSAPAPDAAPLRRININTASEAELQLLPGIGPALAARIVEDRARRGPFKSVADLDRVKGIGPETLRKLRPLATTE